MAPTCTRSSLFFLFLWIVAAGSFLHLTSSTLLPLWVGSYRPDVLIGTRSRRVNSLIAGVAWGNGAKEFRHTADDGVAHPGWTHHDGGGVGCQTLKDTQLNIKLEHCFVSDVWDDKIDSIHQRVSLERDANDESVSNVFLYFYLSTEDDAEDSSVGVLPQITTTDGNEWFVLYGRSAGSSQLVLLKLPQQPGAFTNNQEASQFERIYVAGSRLSRPRRDAAWNVRKFVREKSHECEGGELSSDVACLNGKIDDNSHMIALQITAPALVLNSAQLEFHMFSSERNSVFSQFNLTYCESSSAGNCSNQLESFLNTFPSSSWLEAHIAERKLLFERKITRIFSPTTDLRAVTSYAISNLLGGIGFFVGPMYVRVRSSLEAAGTTSKSVIVKTSSLSLFSGTPSRQKFSRGFLWDEGFHQLDIRRWDFRFFFESVNAWLGLQYDADQNDYIGLTRMPAEFNLSLWNGWIPREAVLGAAGQSRVPKEFQVQDVQVANPPTMLFAILEHIEDVNRLSWVLEGELPMDSVIMDLEILQTTKQRSTSYDSNGYLSCPIRSIEFPKYQCPSSLAYGWDVLQLTQTFLQRSYPKLVKWFKYLHRTQQSQQAIRLDIPKSSAVGMSSRESVPLFRWATRSATHSLASGMDDFPRGSVVDLKEAHLDLQCWLAFFASSLGTICRYLNYKDCSSWDSQSQTLAAPLFHSPSQSILHHHPIFLGSGVLTDALGSQPIEPPWRTDGRCGEEFPAPLDRNKPGFCDPYSASPCCSPSSWCGSGPEYCECSACVKSPKLDEDSELQQLFWGRGGELKDDVKSPHFGYSNLIPLLLGIMPHPTANDTPWNSLWQDNSLNELQNLLDKTEHELLSPYGLRSLSVHDTLYHTGEDYWRGNVWLNINCLFLRAAERYYLQNVAPPVETKWLLIRKQISSLHGHVQKRIKSMLKQDFHNSKTLFENYSDNTGKGQGVSPFLGELALIRELLEHICEIHPRDAFGNNAAEKYSLEPVAKRRRIVHKICDSSLNNELVEAESELDEFQAVSFEQSEAAGASKDAGHSKETEYSKDVPPQQSKDTSGISQATFADHSKGGISRQEIALTNSGRESSTSPLTRSIAAPDEAKSCDEEKLKSMIDAAKNCIACLKDLKIEAEKVSHEVTQRKLIREEFIKAERDYESYKHGLKDKKCAVTKMFSGQSYSGHLRKIEMVTTDSGRDAEHFLIVYDDGDREHVDEAEFIEILVNDDTASHGQKLKALSDRYAKLKTEQKGRKPYMVALRYCEQRLQLFKQTTKEVQVFLKNIDSGQINFGRDTQPAVAPAVQELQCHADVMDQLGNTIKSILDRKHTDIPPNSEEAIQFSVQEREEEQQDHSPPIFRSVHSSEGEGAAASSPVEESAATTTVLQEQHPQPQQPMKSSNFTASAIFTTRCREKMKPTHHRSTSLGRNHPQQRPQHNKFLHSYDIVQRPIFARRRVSSAIAANKDAFFPDDGTLVEAEARLAQESTMTHSPVMRSSSLQTAATSIAGENWRPDAVAAVGTAAQPLSRTSRQQARGCSSSSSCSSRPLQPLFIEHFQNSKLRVIYKPNGVTMDAILQWWKTIESRKLTSQFFSTDMDEKDAGIFLAATGMSLPKLLVETTKRRQINYDFVALVAGKMPDQRHINDCPVLDRSVPGYNGHIRLHLEGRPATTVYRPIAYFTDSKGMFYTFVWGRIYGGGSTIQAVIHLNHQGYPVVGPDKMDPRHLTKNLNLMEFRMFHIQAIHSSVKVPSTSHRDWMFPLPSCAAKVLMDLHLSCSFMRSHIIEVLGFVTTSPGVSPCETPESSCGAFRSLLPPNKNFSFVLRHMEGVESPREYPLAAHPRAFHPLVFSGLFVPLPKDMVRSIEDSNDGTTAISSSFRSPDGEYTEPPAIDDIIPQTFSTAFKSFPNDEEQDKGADGEFSKDIRIKLASKPEFLHSVAAFKLFYNLTPDQTKMLDDLLTRVQMSPYFGSHGYDCVDLKLYDPEGDETSREYNLGHRRGR